MVALKHMALWAELRFAPTALLLVTVAVCLVRAPDQPGVNIGFGSTTARVVPGDLLLVALAIVAFTAIARHGLPRSVWLPLAIGGVLCVLVLATSAPNGATAFVAGAKFVELAAVGLGVVVLLRRRSQLEAVIVDVLILFTLAADLYGIERFIVDGGGRQSSFLGEHDFAALATLPLVYGLTVVFEQRLAPPRAIASILVGRSGCVLGAALASLVGLYLGAGVLVVVTVLRRTATRRALLITFATVAIVSAGTLELRSGDLGFLQSWFGKPPSRPGQYAASWSQRLIYAYIGGRIFLAHPIVGTGWARAPPPKTFVAYLPGRRDAGSATSRLATSPRAAATSSRTDLASDPVPARSGRRGDRPGSLRGARRGEQTGGGVRIGSLFDASGRVDRRPDRSTVGNGTLFGGTPVGMIFWFVAGIAIATPLVLRRAT